MRLGFFFTSKRESERERARVYGPFLYLIILKYYEKRIKKEK